MGLWKDAGETGREKAAQFRADMAARIRQEALDAYSSGLPVYVVQISAMAPLRSKDGARGMWQWSEAISAIESAGWSLSHLPANLDGMFYTGVAVFRRLPAQ